MRRLLIGVSRASKNFLCVHFQLAALLLALAVPHALTGRSLARSPYLQHRPQLVVKVDVSMRMSVVTPDLRLNTSRWPISLKCLHRQKFTGSQDKKSA
jgi:hypothetical protein